MKRILVIDDQRIFTPQDGAEIYHETTSQAGWRTWLLDGPWNEVWLDHDLGMESKGSGTDLVNELEQYIQDYADSGTPVEDVAKDFLADGGKIYVHTMNPSGGDYMMRVLTRYFDVARIDPTPYLDFDATYAADRNPYYAGPRR